MANDNVADTRLSDGTLPVGLADRPRLEALYQTQLMDSGAEERFDRLTRLVAKTLNVPVCLVSLVDTNRQFFKSIHGLPEPWRSARETPLTHSFCQHVVERASPLVINESVVEPLVCDNLAIPDLSVHAYLGMPLLDTDGHVLGSLCAIDTKPRVWTEHEQDILSDFARLVEEQIGLRAQVEQLARYDEQRALVQGELAHRIKNVFSVISSLLLISSRTESDLDTFVRNVTGRIQALSAANDFIIGDEEAGVARPDGLADLLNALLSPFKRHDNQILLTCTPVAIGNRCSSSLALVIHELATNAAKYGALSLPEGYIEVSCEQDDERLRIVWREIGGPPITDIPTRKGFGSRMVARTIESQLFGRIEREFATEGLVVTIDLPLDSVGS
ncbi:GAF domain-containing protein [Agrobacterium sp. lyk4-40-TYG-31]|uniref:GAF domain-containing protein n=1 Tax=Agrobacterium sp. lyk4-40-TYG-31 TaxID=3040276 RepID=UPI00254A685E|nr:GAF domain-containing protein [Agrobacterium sp. lyk4-40-TYG-31]